MRHSDLVKICKNLRWLQIHPFAFSCSHPELEAGNCWATALWGRCWLAWPEGRLWIGVWTDGHFFGTLNTETDVEHSDVSWIARRGSSRQTSENKRRVGHGLLLHSCFYHSFELHRVVPFFSGKGGKGHNSGTTVAQLAEWIQNCAFTRAGSVFEAEAGWVAGQRRRSAQGWQRLKFHFSESSRFPNVRQDICLCPKYQTCIITCLIYTLIFWNI